MDQPIAIVVLLVDDQPIVGEAIRRMLAGHQDIAFHFCADAQRAIDTAAGVRPTTILQDLVMPGVDGFTLVQQLREHPATAQIPIIVLSSREDPRDKSRAFEIGASDYLVKIPDQIELVARIRAHSKSFLAQVQRDEAYRALEELGRQLAEKNAILEALSSLDGLTGIANRRRFDEALETEWRRGRRDGTPVSLVLIDVDFFKRYNDHYGHLQGDDCLRQVARALKDSAHRPADLVARYGGEEFCILMGNTDAPGAAQVAEVARRTVEELAIAHARSEACATVTISLGSATLTPANGITGQDLIKQADAALYQAKKDGRNRHRSAAG